jgi:hypothetical protein
MAAGKNNLDTGIMAAVHKREQTSKKFSYKFEIS